MDRGIGHFDLMGCAHGKDRVNTEDIRSRASFSKIVKLGIPSERLSLAYRLFKSSDLNGDGRVTVTELFSKIQIEKQNPFRQRLFEVRPKTKRFRCSKLDYVYSEIFSCLT